MYLFVIDYGRNLIAVLDPLSYCLQSDQKWKQLAELAISKCEFGLAQECLHQASDFGGLLLLASSAGNAQMVAKLGDTAEKAGQNNVAFLSHFVLGRSVSSAALENSSDLSVCHPFLWFLIHCPLCDCPFSRGMTESLLWDYRPNI